MASSSASLVRPGAGLLETHVTWADVEERLQAALGTRARFGPAKKATQIGAGNGFISRIALVECDWVEGEDGEELPARVAIKMPTCLTLAAIVGNNNDEVWASTEIFIREAHNLEASLYDFIRPFSHSLKIPHSFYAVPFTKDSLSGQIAEEYIDNATVRHIYEDIPIKTMKQIAREIGKIQGLASVEGIDKKPSALHSTTKDVYSHFWSSFNYAMFEALIDSIVAEKPSFDATAKRILEIAPSYIGSNLAVTLHAQLGLRPVLVSGDLYSPNVLLDAETHELKAIVDWQLAHLGCGAEDIYRIAFSALSAKDRRSHMPSLLHEVYSSMEESMNNNDVPYTMEQLEETARIAMPHYAMFFLASVFAQLFQAMLAAPGLSDEEKSTRKENMIDKIVGIIEDIVESHEDEGERLQWKMNLEQ